MSRSRRRLAVPSAIAVLLSRPPAQRLSGLLRPSFLARLTATAAAEVAAVRAIYVPLMHKSVTIYLRDVETVLYRPQAPSAETQHEAMPVALPCRAEAACEHAFANSVPAELPYSAWELYGTGSWDEGEAWAKLPMPFDWEPHTTPMEVQVAYAGVFGFDADSARCSGHVRHKALLRFDIQR